MKTCLAATCPKAEIVTTDCGPSSPSQPLTAGLDMLQAHPDATGIIAPDGATSAAVDKLGKTGEVFTTGAGDPDAVRPDVEAGIIEASPLWDEVEEGQLVMDVARLAASGALTANDTFTAPGLGTDEAGHKVIVFVEPPISDAFNIDQYEV